MKAHHRAPALALLMVVVLLSACTSSQPKSIDPADLSDTDGTKSDPAVAKLKQAYQAAQTQSERRAIILQAIDEGVIYPGRPVSALKAIAGMVGPTQLPIGKDALDSIHLCIVSEGMPTPPPSPEKVITGAYGCLGWSMDVEYDEEGRIRTFYLNNILKGHSQVDRDISRATPAAALKQQYEKARSEFERRSVCLRALDEGALQTYDPVGKLDELFGTDAASHLPAKKDEPASAIVDFASSPADSSSDSGDSAKGKGWFLRFSYLHDGAIENYYLTNVPQQRPQ